MHHPRIRGAARGAFSLALATLVVPVSTSAQDHEHPEGDPAIVGTVSFPVSCRPETASTFETAVAMLHSFWFDAANRTFEEVASADPSCAMARWGVAMTLMGNPMARLAPSPERMTAGRAAAEKAKELAGGASPRERMYIDAVVAYYQGEDRDHPARMRALEESLGALQRAHPDDPEATIFYARTVVANAPPEDLTFARQLAGAALLQPLFEANPGHPGLAHYLIHAYDAPALAERGTAAAFAYAEIAPSAPHALHMPSHIFTRLGYWDESIETNARSAEAEPNPDAAVHPLDYMVYAYLQQGRDGEARAVLARAVDLPDRFYGGILGYNYAAMPSRYVLERSAWSEAAELELPVGAEPFVEAIVRFARSVGAARDGRTDAAHAEAERLAGLEQQLQERGDAYWATIVRAQRLAAEAWVAHSRGDGEGARALAGQAAEVEETVEKHPVTPGPILPARELEGDLLLELGRPEEALRAYEKTLEREPRRARAVYGAARAAEAARRPEVARRYFQDLQELMARADVERPEPRHARRFLGTG